MPERTPLDPYRIHHSSSSRSHPSSPFGRSGPRREGEREGDDQSCTSSAGSLPPPTQTYASTVNQAESMLGSLDASLMECLVGDTLIPGSHASATSK